MRLCAEWSPDVVTWWQGHICAQQASAQQADLVIIARQRPSALRLAGRPVGLQARRP